MSFTHARAHQTRTLLFTFLITAWPIFLSAPAEATTCVAVPQPTCSPDAAHLQGSLDKHLIFSNREGDTGTSGALGSSSFNGSSPQRNPKSPDSNFGQSLGSNFAQSFGSNVGQSFSSNMAQLGVSGGDTTLTGADKPLPKIVTEGAASGGVTLTAVSTAAPASPPTTPLPSTIYFFGTVVIAGAAIVAWRNRSNAKTQTA